MMERNWDTIREILLRLESMNPEKGHLRLSDFPREKAHEYSYHVELLMEAGLVNGDMSQEITSEASDFFATRLTWEGHELLDAIRNDTVWSKTKRSFLKGGMSMTFDLVKTVATDIAAAYMKSSIGN